MNKYNLKSLPFIVHDGEKIRKLSTTKYIDDKKIITYRVSYAIEDFSDEIEKWIDEGVFLPADIIPYGIGNTEKQARLDLLNQFNSRFKRYFKKIKYYE